MLLSKNKWLVCTYILWSAKIYKPKIPIRHIVIYSGSSNLVLTTTLIYLNFQFYRETDGVTMGGQASSTAAEIFIQTLHPRKVWEQFVYDFYSILKSSHFENSFHQINNLHQKINFTIAEESVGEIAFLHTLLRGNNRKISPANISTLDQCCFNIVDQPWNNVDPT